MKKYRIEQIAESYSNVCNKELLTYGSQILYEMEQDLTAMKWALSRMKEFIEANEDKHLPNFDLLKIGYKELLKRVAEFSCPSNLKEQYKTKEKCPLKSECRCVLTDR